MEKGLTVFLIAFLLIVQVASAQLEGNNTTVIERTMDVPHSPVRLTAVLASLLAGNMNWALSNTMGALSDYYYMPKYSYGAMSFLFMHITILFAVYFILAAFIKKTGATNKSSDTLKLLIYLMIIPGIAMLITLLVPSVYA